MEDPKERPTFCQLMEQISNLKRDEDSDSGIDEETKSAKNAEVTADQCDSVILEITSTQQQNDSTLDEASTKSDRSNQSFALKEAINRNYALSYDVLMEKEQTHL